MGMMEGSDPEDIRERKKAHENRRGKDSVAYARLSSGYTASRRSRRRRKKMTVMEEIEEMERQHQQRPKERWNEWY